MNIANNHTNNNDNANANNNNNNSTNTNYILSISNDMLGLGSADNKK